MISAEELRKMPADASVPKWAEREIEKGCLRARRSGRDSATVCLNVPYDTACAVRAHLRSLGYGVKMDDVSDFRAADSRYMFIVSWR